MSETFSRNELFWGNEFQEKLKSSHVIIVGLGGAGGYCVECLARAGVGNLTIIDFDTVSESNINRQIIALNSTVGEKKTDLFRNRLTDINPGLNLKIIDDFYTEDMNLDAADYVVDAIDTMRSKIALLEYCVKNDIPVISSLGAGNRMDPTKLYLCDISEIEDKNAPFISNVIYQLGKKGIDSGITVVVSKEKPFSQEKISELEQVNTADGKTIEFNKIIPSSTPFVASTAGIFMASHIVNKLKEGING